MPRNSGTSIRPRKSVGQSSAAPELSSQAAGARIGAHLARQRSESRQRLERLDAESRELDRRGVVDLLVGRARQHQLHAAQIAARRERQPRFEQARRGQRRRQRREILEAHERAAQRQALDAVGAVRHVEVHGGPGRPRAAAAHHNQVSEGRVPAAVAQLPVAREADTLVAHGGRTGAARQHDVGERKLDRAARERVILPLEPHCNVALARLRRHCLRLQQLRRDGKIDSCTPAVRQSPVYWPWRARHRQ
jgi:hypothetical protein